MEELLQFGAYAKERATLAFAGEGEFAPGEKTCKFCRAKKQCRARSDHNVKMAFNLGELPPLITKEEAGQRLLAMRDVVAYQKDCRSGRCLNVSPGMKFPDGRQWKEDDPATGRTWMPLLKN